MPIFCAKSNDLILVTKPEYASFNVLIMPFCLTADAVKIPPANDANFCVPTNNTNARRKPRILFINIPIKVIVLSAPPNNNKGCYNFTYPRVRFHHCYVQPKKAVVYLKITALIGAMAFTNSTMTSNKFPMNLPATGALSLVNLIKSLKPCVLKGWHSSFRISLLNRLNLSSPK